MTNSRFEDLQRRCQKMKRARIAKVVLLCVGSILIALGTWYQTINVSPAHSLQEPAKEVEQITEPNKNNVTIKKEVTDEASLISEENQNYDTLKLAPTIKNELKPLPSEEKIELKAVMAPPIEDFLAPPEVKKSLSISVKSLSNEESLLKNFHSENTIATSMALAQFYFEKKEYGKAIVWAKESSKLEPVSDKPWIIYAKSKFHLGERAEAIRSLELFLGYVNSNEVKELLTFYKGQQ